MPIELHDIPEESEHVRLIVEPDQGPIKTVYLDDGEGSTGVLEVTQKVFHQILQAKLHYPEGTFPIEERNAANGVTKWKFPLKYMHPMR